jgi:hypothetical protein
LWPGLVCAALLSVTRSHLPATLPMVALQFAVGAVSYALLFLIAVGRDSRLEYMRHLDGLRKRRHGQLRHIGTVNAS